MFFRRYPKRSGSQRELEQIGGTLGAAVDKFGRELGRHRSHRKARQSRGTTPARLSSLPGRRRWFTARWHPERLPREYRRGTAPTVLTRDRDRNGRPQYALDAERRAGGVAAWVRLQLLRLRGSLARLRDRLGWRRRRAGSPRMRGMPLGPPSSGGGDGVLTALVLATTIGFGLSVVSARNASAVEAPAIDMVPVNEALAMRIDEIAYAIAVAEGYFAEGIHDGRTLPYLLNNPGALKKPTLGAADLPTWKDTGLVWFPNETMGWAALRHQVRLMLTGTSAIYEQSDSLLSVGGKYANGDMNWGVNVATELNVPPARTLAELVPGQ